MGEQIVRIATFCSRKDILRNSVHPYRRGIWRLRPTGAPHSRCTESDKTQREDLQKIPFNADLLRWLKANIPVHATVSGNIAVLQLWAGLLLGFFFCLRISEILALTDDDIKFNEDNGVVAVSILIRVIK